MESKTINSLFSDDFLLDLTLKIGLKAKELINDEFNNSKDPYEQPWKPRKDDKPHPILVKTGDLKNSFHMTNTIGAITITSDSSYGGYHQEGNDKLLKREMLPTSNEGIPDKWKEEFDNIFNNVIKEIV